MPCNFARMNKMINESGQKHQQSFKFLLKREKQREAQGNGTEAVFLLDRYVQFTLSGT